MLKKILLIFFILSYLSGYTQTKDSIGVAMPDSLYQKQLLELDSVQQSTKREITKLKNEYDSIGKQFENPIAKLQHKRDSLGRLNLPTGSYTKKIDSLSLLRDGHLAGIKNKTEMLKEKSTKKINSLKLPPEISREAQQYTQGLNKLDVTLPKTDLNFPSMPSLASMSKLSLPGVSIPSVLNLSTPGIDASLPQGASLPQDLGEIKTPEVGGELKELTDGVGEVGKVGDEIEDAKDKLKDPETRKEALAKAEEKATELAPVKDVTEKLDVPKDLPIADGQLSQEELKEQAKKQAIDHFAGKETQVQEAINKMSKLKQKYSSVQSLKDIPKKVPNPMKGKPFIERLVPGIAFQFLFKDAWLADFNPYTGYRINGRLTAGVGWNQRWGFTKEDGFNSQARIYGPRIYGECLAFRGVSARLELETMYTRTPPILKQQPNYNESHREWVPGIFAGLKKDYTIYKRLKGTAFVLFNLYNPDYKSPYGDRLMTRFGLEYSFKMKKKESTPVK